MNVLKSGSPRLRSAAAFVLLLSGILTPTASTFAGSWTPLVRTAPGAVNLMLLLPDGTVMCALNNDSTISKGWFRLTPDIHGSYINGTWTTLASSIDTRLFYSSQVLTDGRVFVAGGEYGTGGAKAEVYNPLTNIWTNVTPPASLWNTASDLFYDSNSEILSDGSVLVMPVGPHTSGTPLLYHPSTNTWQNAGHLFRGSYQDESSWVKLPDNSILTIDPFGTLTERYIPASNSWVNDAVVPVSLYDPFGSELGASFMLANGKAFYLGSTGHTAIYTPSGNTSPGSWVAGPDIPGSHGCPDAPAAMMVTGNILCAVSPVPTSGNHFPSPVTFYEYDPVANSFISVLAPGNVGSVGESSFVEAMLVLPDGNVLWSHCANQLFVYTPTGTPLAAGKPAITSITQNGDGSYHLVGTGLNGISEGANYGDDLQMFSNYPLVRLSDGSGNIYYARTYNWSSTGVQTGATPVTTEFKLPATVPSGTYSLVVVANGYASDSVPLSVVGPDTTPPTPNPMSFASAPAPASTSSITMTSVTATDATSPPVQYFFNYEFGAGGHDSGWVSSTTYVDTGLMPNSNFTYRVKARDSATIPNETTYSPGSGTTTAIETPTGASFANVTDTSIDVTAGGSFTNLLVGTSGLYFHMSPAVGSGANIWVQNTTITVSGLTPGSNYTFQIKARNQNGVETALTAPVSQSTTGSNNIPADCDGNGLVELDPDTACFVEVLLGDNTDPGSISRTDLNADGVVDGLDIPQFIQCVTGGPCP